MLAVEAFVNSVDQVYRPALGAGELIDVVRALLAEQRAAERLLGRYLADLADRITEARRSALGLLEPLRAYADVYHAARSLFSLGVRRTRELVRIGRALRTLPVTERAFVAGDIGYSRVREITRVARPEDEARWVAMATNLPMRTLERRVAEAAGAARAEVTREPAKASWVSPASMEVRLQLRAETWALLQRAMEGARRASEAEGLLGDDEALLAVARDALGAQAAASSATLRRTVVLYECRSCQRLEVETGAGAVELGDGAAAAIGCGAPVVDLRTAGQVERRGGRMPASVERAVRLRDRDRCRVPGCGRRRYVAVHHLQARARGGAHARRNCVCLCDTHHRLLHEGNLVARGEAEGELVFLDAAGRRIGGPGDSEMTQVGSSRSADEERVLTVMGARGGWDADALAAATGLHRGALGAALMGLELSGKVTMDFLGIYTPSAALDARRGSRQTGAPSSPAGVAGARRDARRAIRECAAQVGAAP